MGARRSGLCLALALVATSASADDLVLHNARVYTLNEAQPWASMVAIEQGRIVYVGDEDPAWLSSADRIVDLAGQMVLPGFHDAHAHLASGGTAYAGCPLFDQDSAEAVLSLIRACVEQQPEAAFIRGDGWSIDLFPSGEPPSRQRLDAIDDTRPLMFDDQDGHTLWLNSRALEAYGITPETPDPPGGRIEREDDGRTPRGTLHEDSAMDLVRHHWPPYSDATLERGLRWAQDHFHALGITGAQDAIVRIDGRDPYRSLPAYRSLHDKGELKLRMSLALMWASGGGDDLLERFKALREVHHGDRLQVNMIKFMVDGVVETHTALLLEPYSDRPDTRGLALIPRDELITTIVAADAAGFQAHIHAIGDAATRNALDAFEAAQAANGRRDARHHINHLEFIHDDDVPRFAQLGIGASFEPLWAMEDTYITHLTRPRVGPDRIQTTYRIRDVMDSGAVVAFSSDWTVSSANPLLGIETAITRVDALTDQGEPFLPEQAVTLAEALKAYTLDAAYLGGFESVSGSIETGKYADLVVLDRDLFALPAHEISGASVVATLFEGEVVYGALGAKQVPAPSQ